MKKIIEAVTPPPPRVSDSSAESTRWTRPMIRELGRVAGTRSGAVTSTNEDSTYIPHTSVS